MNSSQKNKIPVYFKILFGAFLVFALQLQAHDDTGSPQSIIKKTFEFDHIARKYPVELRWNEIPGAEYYEIEISRTQKRYFKSFTASKHIMIFPNKNYKWRVIAYKEGQPITPYSHKFRLRVNAPEGEVSSSEAYEPEDSEEEVSEDPAGVEETLPREEDLPTLESAREDDHDEEEEVEDATSEDENVDEGPGLLDSGLENPLFNKSWVGLRAGVNFFGLNQDVGDAGSVDVAGSVNLDFEIQGGHFINDKWAIQGSYKYAPLTFEASSTNQNSEDSELGVISLEALYLFKDSWRDEMEPSWYMVGGINSWTYPFFKVTNTSLSAEAIENSALSLSVGVGYKNHLKKYPKISMNYLAQLGHILSADAPEGNYDLGTGLTMSGLVEAGYRWKKNMSWLLDLKLEYMNFDYTYTEDLSVGAGTETVINPSVGFKFVYDF